VEVCLSGKKKSEWKKSKKLSFNALIFHKKIKNRDEFYKKINLRQEKLFENSLKEIWKIKNICEEKNLQIKDFQSLKSIWIQEIFDFLNWEEKKLCVEKIQKKARNYAKRQMTWWRTKENIYFI
jgi:tRNA dimethylallyltransferase